MSNVHEIVGDDLRVIMCLAFDHRAPCDEVAAVKRCIVDCPQVLHSIELSGTFDFILEVSLPNIAAYHAQLAARAEPLAKLVARYEASFVCRRFVRHDREERVIWVPCHDGVQRLDCSMIDKVIAEGDYMQVYSGKQKWLVHITRKALVAKLDREDFVQIHRSALVRRDFVERLLHHGTHWVARLIDGTEHQIAKSHVSSAIKAIRGASLDAEPMFVGSNDAVEVRRASAIVN